MSLNIDDYYAARAADEDRLAAASIHPAVRATHESFATAYRAHVGMKPGDAMPAGAIAMVGQRDPARLTDAGAR